MTKKRIFLWILFFVSGLILIASYPANTSSSWNPLEEIFVELTAPLQKIFHNSCSFIKDLWSSYIYLIGVKKENKMLKKEIQRLKIENMRYRVLEQRVKALIKILKFRPKPKWNLIAAQVIGYDPTGYFRTIIIDKGKRDGIKINMPVISPDGLVGRIISVSEDYSKVLLITDPDSAVDCIDEGTRARGILKGGLVDEICILEYIEHSEKISPGDTIVTSGLSGIFPRGIPVGRVKEVRKIPGALFKKVKIVPFVDFSRLEEVLVISKEKPCTTL